MNEKEVGRLRRVEAIQAARRARQEAREGTLTEVLEHHETVAADRLYGPDSGHGYFADLAAVAVGEHNIRSLDAAHIPGAILSPEAVEAQKRLREIGRRGLLRASVTTDDVPAFLPVGVPRLVGDAFGEAARASGIRPRVLTRVPMPDTGLSMRVARIDTGVTAVVDDEAAGAPDDDIDADEDLTTPIAMAVATTVATIHLVERSDPAYEQAIAIELGSAIAQKVDDQLLAGTGMKPQTQGLLTVTGATPADYSDGSPTGLEAWKAIAKAHAQHADADGSEATATLMSPQRRAWFAAELGPGPIEWISHPIGVPQLANQTSKAIALVAAGESKFAMSEVRFYAAVDTDASDGLAIRFGARVYVCGLFARRPTAITVLSGTGLSAPFPP